MLWLRLVGFLRSISGDASLPRPAMNFDHAVGAERTRELRGNPGRHQGSARRQLHHLGAGGQWSPETGGVRFGAAVRRSGPSPRCRVVTPPPSPVQWAFRIGCGSQRSGSIRSSKAGCQPGTGIVSREPHRTNTCPKLGEIQLDRRVEVGGVHCPPGNSSGLASAGDVRTEAQSTPPG